MRNIQNREHLWDPRLGRESNFVLREPDFNLRDRVEKILSKAEIEYRRGSAGGGNQLRQPYLSEYIDFEEWKEYPQVEHIHHYCWYVGNYPSLEEKKIYDLCDLLNSV